MIEEWEKEIRALRSAGAIMEYNDAMRALNKCLDAMDLLRIERDTVTREDYDQLSEWVGRAKKAEAERDVATACAEIAGSQVDSVALQKNAAQARAKKAEAEVARLQAVKDRANLLLSQCPRCSKGMLRS